MHVRTRVVAFIALLSFPGTGLGQVTFEFTNSGQILGNSYSTSMALGDLDGDGDLDAMIGNDSQPNSVWTNNGNGTVNVTAKQSEVYLVIVSVPDHFSSYQRYGYRATIERETPTP